MPCLVRTPAQAKAFCLVTDQFQLGIDLSRRLAWVLGSIPDHDPPVRAHGGDNVRVLRLIAGLIDLPLVINLLGDVELDLNRRWLFGGAPSVPTNLFALFIVVGGVGGDGFG